MIFWLILTLTTRVPWNTVRHKHPVTIVIRRATFIMHVILFQAEFWLLSNRPWSMDSRELSSERTRNESLGQEGGVFCVFCLHFGHRVYIFLWLFPLYFLLFLQPFPHPALPSSLSPPPPPPPLPKVVSRSILSREKGEEGGVTSLLFPFSFLHFFFSPASACKIHINMPYNPTIIQYTSTSPHIHRWKHCKPLSKCNIPLILLNVSFIATTSTLFSPNKWHKGLSGLNVLKTSSCNCPHVLHCSSVCLGGSLLPRGP